jgi:hypothetical protein
MCPFQKEKKRSFFVFFSLKPIENKERDEKMRNKI